MQMNALADKKPWAYSRLGRPTTNCTCLNRCGHTIYTQPEPRTSALIHIHDPERARQGAGCLCIVPCALVLPTATTTADAECSPQPLTSWPRSLNRFHLGCAHNTDVCVYEMTCVCVCWRVTANQHDPRRNDSNCKYTSGQENYWIPPKREYPDIVWRTKNYS